MDFTDRYRAMSDGELDKIARDMPNLTGAAQEALRAEFSRRGAPVPEAASGEWEAEEQVVVARFLNLHEALLAKGQLDSAGIACSLRDDNMVRMDWFVSNLLGGVKLTVPPADVEPAKELLSQPILENFDVEGVGEFEQPRCPKCNSIDLSYESLNKPLAYGSAWLGVPIPFSANRWRCAECGHTWEATEGTADSA
jgi:hypothetical protein